MVLIRKSKRGVQKQPLEVFCKKVVLRNFAKFTRKHLRQRLFFNKIAGRLAILLRTSLWHRCFPVNFAKFLRTPWDIIYKNYKNFNVQVFLTELEPILRSEEEASTYVSYDELTKISTELTDKHARQKRWKIRDNHALFMTKELSKQSMKRSKSKTSWLIKMKKANVTIWQNMLENCIFEKQQQKKEANHFGMQPKPFSLIEES